MERLQQGLPAEQSTCEQGSRSPAGPRRLGTATRISASLSRRLSAFFGSASDQDPKAAKFAVLIPGPGMFVNVQLVSRVMIAPPPKTPPISACVPLCAIFLGEPSVYKPQFRPKRKRSRSPAGPRRLRNSDTHERIAVPRLSAFFESALDQGSKAAKFAVLILGHAGFPKRVKRSEGRDTTPHPKRPPFRPVSRCVRSCWQRRVCTHFHPQKRMWAVLQAIATRAFLPCGTH